MITIRVVKLEMEGKREVGRKEEKSLIILCPTQ